MRAKLPVVHNPKQQAGSMPDLHRFKVPLVWQLCHLMPRSRLPSHGIQEIQQGLLTTSIKHNTVRNHGDYKLNIHTISALIIYDPDVCPDLLQRIYRWFSINALFLWISMQHMQSR